MTGMSDQFYKVVGENIRKYRTLRNMSLQEVADIIGVTKKTIQNYETGAIKIDMHRLSEISDALNVNVLKIIHGAESFFGIELPKNDIVDIPLVGKICCGNGVIAYDDIQEYISTPREWLNGGEYFYLRAKGDSMTGARIQEGDLLLIRHQEEVEDGEIAAVLIDDEAVLKRVYRYNNRIVLQSENQKYAPIILEQGGDYNVKIIGKLKKIVVNV